MGLNPSIPLAGIPTPQPLDPTKLAEDRLNVQKLINAVQLQKQTQAQAELQTQQEQVKTQMMKQQQQDANTIRELAPKYAKKDAATGVGTFDLEGLATEAQGRGVNPQTINELRKQNYAMISEKAKAGTESLANEVAHNKAMYEVYEGVKGIDDPDERQKAWETGKNRLRILGADVSHLPGNVPDDDGLTQYEVPLGMHGQMAADAKTLAETNEKNAETASKEWKEFPALGKLVNLRTNEVKDVAGGQITPQMMESKYVAIQQQKNLGKPISAEDAAFLKSYKDFSLLKPAFTNWVAMTGGGLGPSAGGPAPPQLPGSPAALQAKAATAPGGFVSEDGKTINDVPGPIRDLVKKVLEYRGADPSLTQRGPMGAAINQWVAKLDPEHTSFDYPTRADAVKKFSNDASTGEIGAINTALGHVRDLNTAAKTLDGSNLPLLHSLQAKFGLATGDDAASTYKLILHRVGPEMTKAYVKGGGTEGERGSNEADFDISKGQKQILSNIAESAQLLNSKLDSKRQAWNTSFQPQRDQDQFDNRFITPAAKAALAELSANAPTNRGANAQRTMSQAQLAKAAKDHNVSVEEVKRQAAVAGIKVLDK